MLDPETILQGRYRIVRPLGKGGMGAVYEAIDLRLDATVALKETFAIDERLRRQFEQEARLLAQLNHPALPRVSDYFTEDERAFLVMQFITGVDLAEIIAKQPGPFPRLQVVAWADQLLDALIFLHSRERQIIHRDIKPHNLKLTSNGTIALLDFGLAKAEPLDRASGDSSICGYTRRYAPLEQIQDQGTTPQSDIYALGATLYHLLTGIKPADAVIREAALVNDMADPLRPANEVLPAVGDELAGILIRAMAQNPADRYANAKEFREALALLGRNREETPAINDIEVTIARPDTSISNPRRDRSANTFDSYSILKPEEQVLFSSPPKTRTNPVVIGVLFVLLAGLIGTLYGYRRLEISGTAGQIKNEPSQQQPLPSSTQSRMRINPNAIGLSAKTFAGPSQEPKVSERAETSVHKPQSAFRVEGSKSDTQGSNNVTLREAHPIAVRVSAPNMRLPRADLKEDDPAPSSSRLPFYGQPVPVTERQILRTPDGTQVVKFSDGTTRVFRPGEKNSLSNNAPQ
jgi:serine/threonine protein kinase